MNQLACIHIILIILFPFIFIGTPVSSNDTPVTVRGYVKPLFSVTDFESLGIKDAGSKDSEEAGLESALSTTLRFRLSWKPDHSIYSEVAYELTPIFRNTDSKQSFFSVKAADPLSYRAVDLGERLYAGSDGSDFQVYQNLDRAFITYSTDRADIHIGRQPVAFGSARVVNPTDVLTSFTSVELNKEERYGVDAVRITMPAGSLSEIDTGVVSGDNFSVKESAAFARSKFTLSRTDISPLLMLFKQNLLAGLDIAGSIGEAGYWIEGAYVFAGMLDGHKSGEDYLRVSTGLDYSITEDLYAYIEYHFNSAGTGKPEKYGDLMLGTLDTTAYSEGTVYLYGKQYIAPGFSYTLTPLLSASALAIFNLRDHSLLLSPALQYSLSDNTTIDAGAFIGIGKGNDIVRNTDTGITTVSTNAEFSLYADTYFVSVRMYF